MHNPNFNQNLGQTSSRLQTASRVNETCVLERVQEETGGTKSAASSIDVIVNSLLSGSPRFSFGVSPTLPQIVMLPWILSNFASWTRGTLRNAPAHIRVGRKWYPELRPAMEGVIRQHRLFSVRQQY